MTDTTDTEVESTAEHLTRNVHRGRALMLISTAQLLVVLDLTIANMALPFIGADVQIADADLLELPVAPPRLLPDIVDVLEVTSQWGWWSEHAPAPRGLGDTTNEYAAAPSMHVGLGGLGRADRADRAVPRAAPRPLAAVGLPGRHRGERTAHRQPLGHRCRDRTGVILACQAVVLRSTESTSAARGA